MPRRRPGRKRIAGVDVQSYEFEDLGYRHGLAEFHDEADWYLSCKAKAKRCPDGLPVWHYAAKEKGAINCVYFVRMGSTLAVKIGCAASAARRLSALQTSSPLDLSLCGFVSFWNHRLMTDGERKAFELADNLGAKYVRGEWYEMNADKAKEVWSALIEHCGNKVMGAAWSPNQKVVNG